MKYDLKPEDQRKVKLFAHRGEAVVFWISLAALIFLILISLFRYFYLDKIVKEYNKLAGQTHPVMLKLNEVKTQNEFLLTRQQQFADSLHITLDSLARVQSALKQLRQKIPKRKGPAPPQKAKSKVLVLPDY